MKNKILNIKDIKKEFSDKTASEMMKNPLDLFLSVFTNTFKENKLDFARSGINVLQNIFKGEAEYTYVNTIKKLVDQGKVNKDFYKNGVTKNAFFEVLNAIDSDDITDDERLINLKHLSWAILDSSADDKQKTTAYHLLKICKTLDAMDFQILLVCYKHTFDNKPKEATMIHVDNWRREIINDIGNGLTGIITKRIEKLEEMRLIELPDFKIGNFHLQNEGATRFGLSITGHTLCKLIENYNNFEDI